MFSQNKIHSDVKAYISGDGANGIDVNAAAALPIRIGTLHAFTTDPGMGGTVFVDGVQVVKADLAALPIATEAIAALPVPEPGALLQAAFAIAAGACLSRSRRAGRGHRER